MPTAGSARDSRETESTYWIKGSEPLTGSESNPPAPMTASGTGTRALSPLLPTCRPSAPRVERAAGTGCDPASSQQQQNVTRQGAGERGGASLGGGGARGGGGASLGGGRAARQGPTGGCEAVSSYDPSLPLSKRGKPRVLPRRENPSIPRSRLPTDPGPPTGPHFRPPGPGPSTHPIREVLHDQPRHGARPRGSDPSTAHRVSH